MTLAFLMHPNTVVTGRVCRKGDRSARKDCGGKRIIRLGAATIFPRNLPSRARETREREKKKRLGETCVENEERSGKRRRGAYQRHLLIYFAPVGLQPVQRGNPHQDLPLPCYRHRRRLSVCFYRDTEDGEKERERKRTRFILGEIYTQQNLDANICIYRIVTSVM